MSNLSALAGTSIEVITGHQQPSGAYPASPEFSAYRGFCWFRDGSFIADGASAAGAAESADRFFDWCASTLERHADRIGAVVAQTLDGHPVPDEDMLPTRFRFDGSIADDDWWDFQLDGFGTWLWAVVEHARRHGRDLGRWATAIGLSVDYLTVSWQRPCFDWWEEHSEQVHVSTLGCIGAGLEAVLGAGVLDGFRTGAARLAAAQIRSLVLERGVADGHLTKWFGRTDPDASLSALVGPMGWLDPADPLAVGTVRAVRSTLAVDGGVHRFADDVFYGGGRWPLLSCLLGQGLLATGDRVGARAMLDWAASTATADGLLPEQVAGHLLAPDRRAEWVERWGEVATPLLWSHGQYLRLWHDLGRP
ncbi:MAG: glycoside hydrolase family 15 [Actinobacteria bacterium]|nr:glycoside hydrolase family 15 [Actinomycetota bacterium]